MKNSVKIAMLVFIITIPAILFAQVNPLDSYINQYEGTPGFYYMDMKTNMFNFNEDDGSPKTSDDVIDFKVVSFEQIKNVTFDAKKIYEDFSKTMNKDVYKGLVEVKSSGENVDMLVKKQGDKISEIVVIVREKDDTTLMVATGNFDLKDIAKLSELKNCKGLQTLEKLCEN